MFKIGDFSRLSFVTVKALRYYDEIGLLKAVRVDRFTGYRYYSADQLPRLNYIVALKEMGLSLQEVTTLVNHDLTPAQMRDIFILKRAELQQRVADEQRRLERVDRMLQIIQKEGAMPEYQVVIKKVEPQLIASIREVYPTDMQDVFGPALTDRFDELERYLVRHGAGYAAPGIAIWHGSYSGLDNAAMDVEAAAPDIGPRLRLVRTGTACCHLAAHDLMHGEGVGLDAEHVIGYLGSSHLLAARIFDLYRCHRFLSPPKRRSR